MPERNSEKNKDDSGTTPTRLSLAELRKARMRGISAIAGKTRRAEDAQKPVAWTPTPYNYAVIMYLHELCGGHLNSTCALMGRWVQQEQPSAVLRVSRQNQSTSGHRITTIPFDQDGENFANYISVAASQHFKKERAGGVKTKRTRAASGTNTLPFLEAKITTLDQGILAKAKATAERIFAEHPR